jgi:hypothetical protein
MSSLPGSCSDSEDRRPRDSVSGLPLETEQPGYYPGFSTLGQKRFWDEATRRKVLDRVEKIPPIRFFNPEEASLMEAVVAHLIPQDDRMPSRRIPIVPNIDRRLYEGRTPGYRFARMPPDGDAYRLGSKAIERMSVQSYGRTFQALTWREQDELLKSIHDAKPKPGAADVWEKMPIHRFWALMVQDCAEVYYAHPWAWDEIGLAARPIHAVTCGWNMASRSHGKSTRNVMSGKPPRMPFLIRKDRTSPLTASTRQAAREVRIELAHRRSICSAGRPRSSLGLDAEHRVPDASTCAG